MRFSKESQKNLRTWISFLMGITFLCKFAFLTPTLLNAYMTLSIALLIFGPGVVSLWKSGGFLDDDDED